MFGARRGSFTVAVMMCMSGSSHSLPSVVASRLGKTECQLLHIVLAGLPWWLDALLTHSNGVLVFSAAPVGHSVLGWIVRLISSR